MDEEKREIDYIEKAYDVSASDGTDAEIDWTPEEEAEIV